MIQPPPVTLGESHFSTKRVKIQVGEKPYTVEVDDLSTSPVQVRVDGETLEIDVKGLPSRTPTQSPPAFHSTTLQPAAPTVPQETPGVMRSPMPGRVVTVNVKQGKKVSAGDEVCVIEAMKMEQSIRTTSAGVIKAVHIKPMQQVNTNDLLVEME